MPRATLAAGLAALVLLAAAPAPATGAAADPAIVAVIDTGIAAGHPEFAAGQIVAWWDFTGERGKSDADQEPANHPGATWDPVVGPYDPQGHGTATASLVAGQNRAAGVAACGKTSWAPGTPLAIAKVFEPGLGGYGASEDDIASAIRWAVLTVGADVLSMSLGSPALSAGHLDRVDESIAWARARGVLVVVAAGNGYGNVGLVPGPSWSQAYGYSTSALVVGGGGRSSTGLSLTSSSDPEVASWSDSVCVARTNGGYGRGSGTSYATPLVAGAAAAAIDAARANARPDDPATIERVLKHAARDTLFPYTREGWGHLADAEVAAAVAAAAAGTVPAHVCQLNLPCTDPAYEAVPDALRGASDDATDGGPAGSRVFVPAPLGGPGTMVGAGLATEGEIYAVPLAAGATGRVDVSWSGLADVDLRVYLPGALDDGLLAAEEMVARSARQPGDPEAAAWVAETSGTYLAVLLAYAVPTPTAVSVTGGTYLAEGVLLGDNLAAA